MLAVIISILRKKARRRLRWKRHWENYWRKHIDDPGFDIDGFGPGPLPEEED